MVQVQLVAPALRIPLREQLEASLRANPTTGRIVRQIVGNRQAIGRYCVLSSLARARDAPGNGLILFSPITDGVMTGHSLAATDDGQRLALPEPFCYFADDLVAVAVHVLLAYLTFRSFGFALLAAGEALRLALARIAPADFWLMPSFFAILDWTDVKDIRLLLIGAGPQWGCCGSGGRLGMAGVARGCTQTKTPDGSRAQRWVRPP